MKKKTLLMTVAIFIIVLNTTAQEKGTFTDTRDGKIYKTVKIGTQTWMAENLAYKTDSGCWVYNDDYGNVSKYGYLYTWETAKSSCPVGWHLPSDDEYLTLLTNFGGTGKVAYEALIEGGKSGFSALFGGSRQVVTDDEDDKIYENLGAFFWSSTAGDTGQASLMGMYSYDKEAYLYNYFQSLGFSVRCNKD